MDRLDEFRRFRETMNTDPEIHDALNVGLVVGGSTVIPHVRHAFATLEQLRAEEGGRKA